MRKWRHYVVTGERRAICQAIDTEIYRNFWDESAIHGFGPPVRDADLAGLEADK